MGSRKKNREEKMIERRIREGEIMSWTVRVYVAREKMNGGEIGIG